MYFGETGRTLYVRGFEHLEGHRRRYKESILVEHEEDRHEGQVVGWTMEALEFPRGNLLRQAKEAHMISKNSHRGVLNRSGEWGQNLHPKLTLEDQSGNLRGRVWAQTHRVQPLGPPSSGEPNPSRKRTKSA